MNKRFFLLQLAAILMLTTQVNAQSQTPSIIISPAILDAINGTTTDSTTPDRTSTTDTGTVDSVDNTGQTDNTDTVAVDTTDNSTTTDSTADQPVSNTDDTPSILGPDVERPVYTIEPTTTTETPTTTVTPSRPTRPTRPTPEIPVEENTEPEVENCPLFNPLDQNPVKCPEAKPVIPVLPIMMVVGPLAGLLLFFFVFKSLQNSHLKTETRLEQKRQQTLTTIRNSEQQQQTYKNYLDFLSSSLTESKFNQTEFLNQQAQLELFGSAKMLELHQKVGTAFQHNNHQEIKTLLPALITQIRLEE
jgi:hypothetical protein